MREFRIFFSMLAASFAMTAGGAYGEEDAIPMASVMQLAKATLPQQSEVLTATAVRHLRSGTVLELDDFAVEGENPSMVAAFKRQIAGQELKRTVYAGKPIASRDIGPPTVIKRNDLVSVEFTRGPLLIMTEGRALDEAQ